MGGIFSRKTQDIQDIPMVPVDSLSFVPDSPTDKVGTLVCDDNIQNVTVTEGMTQVFSPRSWPKCSAQRPALVNAGIISKGEYACITEKHKVLLGAKRGSKTTPLTIDVGLANKKHMK